MQKDGSNVDRLCFWEYINVSESRNHCIACKKNTTEPIFKRSLPVLLLRGHYSARGKHFYIDVVCVYSKARSLYVVDQQKKKKKRGLT